MYRSPPRRPAVAIVLPHRLWGTSSDMAEPASETFEELLHSESLQKTHTKIPEQEKPRGRCLCHRPTFNSFATYFP